MRKFEWNQVEAAIIETFGARHARVGELKLRLKRLLVTDRRLRSNARVNRYAFYSQKPAGSGVENKFGDYEAFALLAALLVLEHGVPQAKAVGIMREVRADLEAAHRETLQKDPKALFDPEAVRAIARNGLLAVDNTAPVFLAFVKLDVGRGRVSAVISVCRGLDELGAFLKKHSVAGSGSTHFEFVRLMRDLAVNLSKTRPTKRGRSTL